MAAGKLLDLDACIDAGNFSGEELRQRVEIQLLAMPDGGGIGGHEILL